jgi:hypothetical protein
MVPPFFTTVILRLYFNHRMPPDTDNHLVSPIFNSCINEQIPIEVTQISDLQPLFDAHSNNGLGTYNFSKYE